jgi:hypothetical protein
MPVSVIHKHNEDAMSRPLAEVGEVTIDYVALYLASHARSVARALAKNELEIFFDLVLLAEHETQELNREVN